MTLDELLRFKENYPEFEPGIEYLGVVAGSRVEFEEFMRPLRDLAQPYNHPRTFIMGGALPITGIKILEIGSPNQLRGLQNFALVWVGTYALRKDIEEINALLQIEQTRQGMKRKGLANATQRTMA